MLNLTAQAGILAAAGAGGTTTFLVNVVPLVLIFVVFYFLLIRPQQQRLKAHKEMITNLRRGDVVVTGGGLIGKITRVAADEATVELAENVRVKVLKSTISEVRAKTEPAKAEPEPANDAEGD
jgi:preprotein translocase subunit YajC